MRIAPCPSRRPSVVRAGRRLSLLALALLSLSSAANARDPVSGARLPYRILKDLGPKGQRITEIFSNGAPVTAPLTGPVAFAAYNVDIANAMIDLHVAAVRNSGLDTYARELATLVACRETNYALEWNAHEPAAIAAGIDPRVIATVRHRRPLDKLTARDAAIIRFGRELLHDRRMSDKTFDAVVNFFGRTEAMNMVGIMSSYAISGFYAVAVDEKVPGTPQLPRTRP